MESVSNKKTIQNTFSSVRNFSFEEKKSPLLDEQKVNEFLDAILDFKTILENKSAKLNAINQKLESITWVDDLEENSLMIINDIISLSKDLHSSLIRQYVLMNSLRMKGIAKSEIRNFKESIDELKESAEDLESVFFFLPQMPEFNETTKKLSLVG